MVRLVRQALAHDTVRQVIRYGFVGVAATVAHVCMVVSLVEAVGVRFFYANLAGYVTGFVVSYVGHLTWTFGQRGGHQQKLPRFLLAWISLVCLGQLTAYVMVDVLGLPYLAALTVIVTLIPLLGFTVGKIWVFKDHPSEQEAGS